MSERLTLERLEQIQWAFAELLTEARRAREAEARLERERDEAIADNAALLCHLLTVVRPQETPDGGAADVMRADATLDILHPGTALLEEHRAALAEVRSWEARYQRQAEEVAALEKALSTETTANNLRGEIARMREEHRQEVEDWKRRCDHANTTAGEMRAYLAQIDTLLLVPTAPVSSAVGEKVRKALVRARNEGLKAAVDRLAEAAQESDRALESATGEDAIEARGARVAFWAAWSMVRALMGPET